MQAPKVVIIGAGFAGLNAAHALRKAEAEILVLDKSNHHLFQPLLYQVATGALGSGNIAVPIRDILSKNPNTTVLLEEIVEIDKQKQIVIGKSGDIYAFDYLILAPGSTHSYFGHPEWEESAPALKTLEDALRIREKIFLSYELAERSADPKEAEKHLNFVVIGAGPTGVEMAGAIAEIAKSTIDLFRNIKLDQIHITLIEGAPQVLPAYPLKLGNQAQKDLEKMGVKVILNSFVTDISKDRIQFGDKHIESKNIFWAAGNAYPPILKALNIPLDRAGRVIVHSDLSIPDYPNIFVIGDAAFYLDKKGNILPGIAPVAIQQGRYVANIIKNKTPQDKRKPFVYFDKGMLATIGKAKAVGMVGKLMFSGFLAWLIWSVVHIFYLISFGNKIVVAVSWFYVYIRDKRMFRLIIKEEP